MTRPATLLPPTLPPFGVNRQQAAALIGVSTTLFDRLVAEGLMPPARVLYSRRVWDVAEVADAFRALPHHAETVDGAAGGGNPWDDEQEA